VGLATEVATIEALFEELGGSVPGLLALNRSAALGTGWRAPS